MKQIDDIFKIVAPLISRLNESRDPNRDANLADVNKIMELATEIETELKPALKGTDAFTDEANETSVPVDESAEGEDNGLEDLIDGLLSGDGQATEYLVKWISEIDENLKAVSEAVFEPQIKKGE